MKREPLSEEDLQLGQRLKAAREALSVTQRDFGKGLSTNRHAIQNYETGRVKLPWAVAYNILKHYPRISVTWLGEGERPILVQDNHLECLEIPYGTEPFMPGRTFLAVYHAQWKHDIIFAETFSALTPKPNRMPINEANIKKKHEAKTSAERLKHYERWELKILLIQLIKREVDDFSREQLIAEIEKRKEYGVF